MSNSSKSSIERRFDDVDAAVAEQRQYTEWAYSRLEARIETLDASMTTGLARLERKLDQFIDAQSKANDLVERRLQRLASGRRRS